MSNLSKFLLTTGRTLSHMALYSLEHPTVKDAVQESHRLLTAVLTELPEVVISLSEGKIVVNGQIPVDIPEVALRPYEQLLSKFDLHSISFLPGITAAEMVPFYRLAYRGEVRKTDKDVAAALASQNVTHIEVNQAVYAKISEGETIGGGEDAAGKGGDGDSLWKRVEDLSLNELLKSLIGKAVPDPTDQERVFRHALGLIKKEIEQTVERVTLEFAREKTRLTNERARTENVVETMAEGVVVVDQSGNVLMMNPVAEEIYGVKLGECLGKPLWERVREEQMMALAKDLTVPSDRPTVKEVQVQAAAETKKTLRASTAAVQDTEGRIVGMVSVLSDVTKQRELIRMQNEFMANVTHELRTPIHAVKLAVGTILDGSAGAVSSEQNKMLTLAGRNIDRLSRLIDDLLDFSKMEAGTMEIRPQMMQLEPLLKEAESSLQAWASSRGLTLRLEPVPALPPVYADSDRVLQIVINLLSNAIKFTPSGGTVTLRAKVIQEGGKSAVRIEVQDTGKGISQSDQKRIFERFVQLGSDQKLDLRGTGLGLSICRALVALHKGQMAVQSPPPGAPHGSLFAFSLPAVHRSETAAPAKPESPIAPRLTKRSFWRRLASRLKFSAFVLIVLADIAGARPYWGRVRRVLEADRIQLEDGSVVRYLGIEAPAKGSPHYTEAASMSRQLVEKKEVRLRYGLQERDVAGDWLAYVFVDGVHINEELVRLGMAIVSVVTNEEEFLKELLAAERRAAAEKRGIWEDTKIDPYPVRVRNKQNFPWATVEEQKTGIKE